MTIYCSGPDPAQGVALRLSDYASCQARALGENGFQALAGGPLGTSVLTGLVTIFIALIGYRFILGNTPNLRDGVGWAVRLGFVLALVTGWSAFQTLVYRVAVDGPGELATIVLPASGLPSTDLDARVQQAYDTMRLGTIRLEQPQSPTTGPSTPSGQQVQYQSPLPNTASIFVISTSGAAAALRIAIGFLLAVAPLALMSLLFDGTIGLFVGWLRALAGAALAVLGVSIVSAIDLVLVESELARLQILRLQSMSAVVDPQALTTIVALFAIVTLVTLMAAMRMASALSSPIRQLQVLAVHDGWPTISSSEAVGTPANNAGAKAIHTVESSRVSEVTEVLTRTVQREQLAHQSLGSQDQPLPHRSLGSGAADRTDLRAQGGYVRRSLGRRTGSAARRDRRA